MSFKSELVYSASIVVTYVFADNGVIHAIDTVVLPFELPNLCRS